MAARKQGGSTTRASSSSNPPTPKPKPSSPKPLPNYLKPTISSSLNFSNSRTSLRSNTDASGSTTNRRNAYEKPPSPAHLRRALHNSTTTTRTHPSSTKPVPPHRPSSSLSLRSTKPVPQRPLSSSLSSRSTKPVPQRSSPSLPSRSTKAAPAGPVTRRNFPANSSASSLNIVSRKAGPRSITSESSVEFEGRNKEPLLQEEKPDEELETQVKESKDEDAVVAEEGQVQQDAAPCEKEELLVVIREERSIAEEAPRVEEEFPSVAECERSFIDKSNEEEAPREKEELLIVTEGETSIDKREEEIVTKDGTYQGKAEVKEEIGIKEDLNKVDEKHVVVELKESVEGSNEGEETSVEAVQVKTEDLTIVKAEHNAKSAEVEQVKNERDTTVKVVRPAKQMQPGKKDKQAYNDVIEETAGKLMERRNRVRALAGAFETVISLQDTK